MEEAESKALALERVAELEDDLGRVNERLQELEVKSYLGLGREPLLKMKAQYGWPPR